MFSLFSFLIGYTNKLKNKQWGVLSLQMRGPFVKCPEGWRNGDIRSDRIYEAMWQIGADTLRRRNVYIDQLHFSSSARVCVCVRVCVQLPTWEAAEVFKVTAWFLEKPPSCVHSASPELPCALTAYYSSYWNDPELFPTQIKCLWQRLEKYVWIPA